MEIPRINRVFSLFILGIRLPGEGEFYFFEIFFGSFDLMNVLTKLNLSPLKI
jgi:hypothetical protein